MLNSFYLKYNITHNRFSRADGSLTDIVITDKDDNLFAIEFTESKGPTESPVNLNGVNSFRLVCDETLSKTANRLFFQDTYNQGNDLEYEDLSIGRVTHLVSANTAAIDAYLDDKSSVDAVMEYSVLDALDRPQTLTTGGIKIKIVPGVDYGNEGTPAPSSPTYLTAAEISALLPLKSKYDAIVGAAVTNDNTQGYSVGSFWIDVVAGTVEVCLDGSTGAAVWVLTALSVAQAAKLAAIETGATADQTGAEIKALYELEADTNAFTDALIAKLNSLSKDHYGDPVENLVALRALTEASLVDDQRRYVVSEGIDYFYDIDAVVGDEAPDDQTGSDGFWIKPVSTGETALSIKTKYESNADTNEFDDTEKSKLAAIETAATADQTDEEIETAYDNQVPQVSTLEAQAGTEVEIRRWSPADVKEAINSLSGSSDQGELTSAPTINWNVAVDGKSVRVILDQNATFNLPTNIVNGQEYTLIIEQDVTGGRVPSFVAQFKTVSGAPIPVSQVASAKSFIKIVVDNNLLYVTDVTVFEGGTFITMKFSDDNSFVFSNGNTLRFS